MSRDDDNFISRWSKRKIAARSGAPVEEAKLPPAVPAKPVEAGPPAQPEASVLPPVESLTPESDFTPFMKTDVDPGIKREALKTLFRDPRFNVMDGLNQMKHLGAYLEEPEKAAEEASGEATAALQNPMQEQPVAVEPADTASEETTAVSVTESPKSGGTLPRNEA